MGYSERSAIERWQEQEASKSRELKSARTYLRRVAKLVASELPVSDVRVNRAGPAVSGEVTARYWRADGSRGVYVMVSADMRDHGILYRQITSADPFGASMAHPNLWAGSESDPSELAGMILSLARGAR